MTADHRTLPAATNGALLLLVTLGLGLAATPGAAQNAVYKWVDAQNNVHYSDRPPPGQESTAEPMPTVARSHRTAQATAPGAKPAEAAPAKPEPAAGTGAAEKKVAQDVAAVRDEQCQKARSTYDSYIKSRRIYRTGDNNERVYLSAQEIDQARIDARKDLDAVCGDGSAQ